MADSYSSSSLACHSFYPWKEGLVSHVYRFVYKFDFRDSPVAPIKWQNAHKPVT